MLGAMALTFAACEDGPSVVPPQSNPQGPVLEAGNIAVVAAGPMTSGKVDLANYETSNLEIAQVQSVDTLLENEVIRFGFEYSSKEDFSNAIEIPVVMNGNSGSVAGDDLMTAHIALFGKSPSEKTVYYRIPVYVTRNNVEYRWGGTDFYAIQGSYIETIPVTTIIEDAYYFLGNATTWDLAAASAFKFDHSSANVYDDPVFTYTVTVEEPDCYWKIAPQSAIDSNSWDTVIGVAVDGSTDLEGLLVDEDPGAGRLVEPGTYVVTINLMEMTYSMKLFTQPMFLACRGGANGWGWEEAGRVPLCEGKDWQYNGAVLAAGEFKYCADPDWADNWGFGEVTSIEDGTGIETYTLVPGGANIPVAQDGLQWIRVDLNSLTAQTIHISSVGVVGGFSTANWAIDNYFEMTPNEDSSIWTWTGDLEGAEWKIAFNHSWSYNYGGDIANPVFDAGNISGYNGKHTVTLDCTGQYPKIEVVKAD